MRSRDPNRWATRSVLALALGVAAIWQGCNVFAGLDDVKFEGSGGAEGGAAGAAGGTTTTSSGPGTGGTSTSSAQGGAAGSTTTSTSTTGGMGGSPTSSSSSSGGTGTMSTSSSSSSSTGGAGGTVSCGNGVFCAIGPQACCWNLYPGMEQDHTGKCLDEPVDTTKCDTSPTVTGMHSIVECQTSAQCSGGQVCCGTVDTTGPAGPYYSMVTCRPTCPDVTMCKGVDDTTTCDPMLTCAPSMLLPNGYYRCTNTP